MTPTDDIHIYRGRDEVVVVALGSEGARGVPRLRRRLRAVATSPSPPSCVVIDTTGATTLDATELAGQIAADSPMEVPVAVVCPRAADRDPEDVGATEGVVMAATLRQALEACRALEECRRTEQSPRRTA